MKIRILMLITVTLATAGLAGCDADQTPQVIEPPRLIITCPDPDAREMLTAESTYRDLARSRAESLHGWTTCSDALQISTNRRTE